MDKEANMVIFLLMDKEANMDFKRKTQI